VPTGRLGDWSTTDVVKFIQDTFEQNPPKLPARLVVDDVDVAGTLTVRDLIRFTKDANYHSVGATGEPAFENSWANVSGRPAAFWRDPLGFVHLRGRIDSGSVGDAAFTLPPGLRPPQAATFAVVSNDAMGAVEVGTDGTVTPVTPSDNTYVSLDGISFKV
jgi:hypothetical protein